MSGKKKKKKGSQTAKLGAGEDHPTFHTQSQVRT